MSVSVIGGNRRQSRSAAPTTPHEVYSSSSCSSDQKLATADEEEGSATQRSLSEEAAAPLPSSSHTVDGQDASSATAGESTPPKGPENEEERTSEGSPRSEAKGTPANDHFPSPKTTRAQVRRHYSSSESESSSTTTTTTPANLCSPTGSVSFDEFAHRKRHARRDSANSVSRRGAKRKRSDETENPPSSSLIDGRIPPRVLLSKQPKAPSNTTQFLITDREERESLEREMLLNDSSASIIRPRSMSAIGAAESTSLNATTRDSSDDDDDEATRLEDEVEDPEFAAVYENAKLERIEGMSREQVNREMLVVEKSNLHLLDRVGHLKTENNRLKHLLSEHGIQFVKDTSSETPATTSAAAFSNQGTRIC